MQKKLVVSVLLAAGVLMSGCSTAPTKEQVAKDDVKASVIRANAQDEMRAHEQKRMEAEISQMPDWALKQPKPDETGVYAVGIAESDKLRVALHKATLEAEFGLAKSFDQEVSGSERMYTQDNNSVVGQEQYTALIDKLVSQVPVVGFEIVSQEVKTINGKYNAFVLVKLPYAQFNRVLQEQRAKAGDRTIAKAFDDLDHRLSQRRQQRLDEAKQEKELDVKPTETPADAAKPAPVIVSAAQPGVNKE